jgi:hypothetical protein
MPDSPPPSLVSDLVPLLETPARTAGGAAPCLVLAHGAGAPMTSPFMETMAALLSERGVGVVRFEFGYMAAQRKLGTRRPPPKAERLIAEYEDVIDRLAGRTPLFIGGKSMGGRVASLIADRLHADGRITGLVCLGYPFHPPKKPESLRTAHLADLACPALVVQGTRDPLGSRAEVEGYGLSPSIQLSWIEGGDHDLAPSRSAAARETALGVTADRIARFVKRRLEPSPAKRQARAGAAARGKPRRG